MTAGVPTSTQEEANLDVRIQSRIPAALPAECRTALFILGSCFHPLQPVRGVEIVVDRHRVRPTAQGMPRLDLFNALHPGAGSADGSAAGAGPADLEGLAGDDPLGLCYRSGFWATVPVCMPKTGAVRIGITATLADGSSVSAELARISAVEPEANRGVACEGARVGIAMATFEPELDLFRAQIESIRRQTMEDWVCLISDDCTPPARADEMRSVIEGDRRFVFSQGDRRLGFYRNFERALELVPGGTPMWPSPTRTIAGTRRSSRRCLTGSATRTSSTAISAWSMRTVMSWLTPTGRGAATTTRISHLC